MGALPNHVAAYAAFGVSDNDFREPKDLLPVPNQNFRVAKEGNTPHRADDNLGGKPDARDLDVGHFLSMLGVEDVQ